MWRINLGKPSLRQNALNSTVQPGCDFVTAMSELLRCPIRRTAFSQSPRRLAQEMGLSAQDTDIFCALDPSEIETQALGLLDKRFHEVRQLVPHTMSRLNSEARDLFRYYAANYWPTGHRRHLNDAQSFLAFLEQNQIATDRRDRV